MFAALARAMLRAQIDGWATGESSILLPFFESYETPTLMVNRRRAVQDQFLEPVSGIRNIAANKYFIGRNQTLWRLTCVDQRSRRRSPC